MTDCQFYTIFTAAAVSTDRAAFVSDWALSPIWGDEEDAPVPADRVEQLSALWDAAHLTVRDIRRATGLSQAAFAQRFCIPRRTVEDWERGIGSCSLYLRLLLAQAVGLYQRP